MPAALDLSVLSSPSLPGLHFAFCAKRPSVFALVMLTGHPGQIKCSGKVQGGKCGRCQRDGVECTFRAKMKPGPRQGQARKNGRDAEPPRKKKGARRRKRGANPAETAPTKEDDGGGSGGGNPQKKKRKTMAEQHELPPTPGHEGGKKSRSAPIPPLGSLVSCVDSL